MSTAQRKMLPYAHDEDGSRFSVGFDKVFGRNDGNYDDDQRGKQCSGKDVIERVRTESKIEGFQQRILEFSSQCEQLNAYIMEDYEAAPTYLFKAISEKLQIHNAYRADR